MKLFKRITAFLLVMAMMLGQLPVTALASMLETYHYTLQEDGTVTIDSYVGNEGRGDTHVEIPESLDGGAVTALAEEAFAYNTFVDTVVIPASVTAIGNSAFYHCDDLKAIAFLGDAPDLGFTVAEGSRNLEKLFVLDSCQIGDFCALLVNDLGEAEAAQVEVLEFADEAALRAAYDAYVSSLTTAVSASAEAPAAAAAAETTAVTTDAAAAAETETFPMEVTLEPEMIPGVEVEAMDPAVEATDATVAPTDETTASTVEPTEESIPVPTVSSTVEGSSSPVQSTVPAEDVSSEEVESDTAVEDTEESGSGAVENNQSGDYGDVFWSFYEGELYVTYNGNSPPTMEAQTSAAGYPWYALKDQITAINVYTKSIADYAFDGYTNVTKITIGHGLQDIGSYAFRGCSSVKTIRFWADSVSIADNAFTGITANVEYSTSSNWTASQMKNYGGTLTWGPILLDGDAIASGTCGDNATWALDDYGNLAISGSGAVTNLTSAESYPWYEYRDQTSNIKIYGVTNVPDYAFAGWSTSNVDIGDSVTSVGKQAFANCASLEWLQFEGPAVTIAEDAFLNLNGTTVTFPYSHSDSWQTVIQETYGAADIQWSQFVKNIAWGNYGDTGIQWYYREGNSLSIQMYGDTPGVAMPTSEPGDYPWSQYADEATYIHVGSVTSIADNAFEDFAQVGYINIDRSVTAIGANAFSGCTGLGTVWFNGEAPSIAADAFTGVTAEILYPDYSSWDSVANKNYGGSLSWCSVVPDEPTDPSEPENIAWGTYGDMEWAVSQDYVLTISGQGDMPDFDSISSPWEDYNYALTAIVIEEGITSVGKSAFTNCHKLTSVTLPESLEKIGDSGFFHCPVLPSIVIPEQVTEIGNSAFYRCEKLSEITFLGDAPTIDSLAFDMVTATAYYPAGNSTWTADVMQDYSGDITWVASGSTDIVWGTFGEDLSWRLDVDYTLTVSGEGDMPDYTSQYDAPWYDYHSDILKVVIEDGITGIGDYNFYACQNMTSLDIAESVVTIGNCAFALCSSLDDIGIPEGVSTIGESAFEGCTGAKGVAFSTSVTKIGDWAFEDCTNLRKVFFYGDAPDIGPNTFGNITAIAYYYLDNPTWSSDNMRDYGGALAWVPYDNSDFDRGSCGDNVYWRLTGDDTLIIGGDGDMKDYSLNDPENYVPWYNHLEQIDSVFITSGVSRIGNYAFANCSNLISVEMGDSVEIIGDSAFSNCTLLENISLSESLTVIELCAFMGCRNLISIEFPLGLGHIGSQAFDSCESLTQIVLPNSVNTLESGAFQMCLKLDTVEIPDSITEIPMSAFAHCENLNYVSIPDSITMIGDCAFSHCLNLTEITFEGDAPTFDGPIFDSCNSITAYYPADNDTWTDKILDSYYGASVDWVSYGRNDIASGTFGENLSWRLDEDYVLTISGEGDMPDYDNGSMMPWYDYRSDIITVVIGDGITGIGAYNFYSCDQLVSLELADSVESIGDDAFCWCENLAELSLNQVKTIGSGAFVACWALTSIEIPEGVTSIGEWAFDGCKNVTSVSIPSTLTTLPNNIFCNCSGLTSVTIPANITEIGDSAFYYCISLTEITFEGNAPILGSSIFEFDNNVTAYYPGDNATWTDEILDGDYGGTVTWISYADSDIATGTCGENAYWRLTEDGTLIIMGNGEMENYTTSSTAPWYRYQSNILRVVVEEGITNIGDYAFYYCSNAAYIFLPEGLEAVGCDAFVQCDSLVSIEFPDSVETIGRYAFTNCDNLVDVKLPNNLKVLEQGLFTNSKSLKTVTIPDSVTTIKMDAFLECFGLTHITIPASVSSIDYTVFGWCYALREITFLGDAPTFSNNCFTAIDAYCYYPKGNDTWTSDVMQNYKGNVAWIPYNASTNPSGSCGDGLNWELDLDSATLTISGEGEMESFEHFTAPWVTYADSIRFVTVEEGVTNIGSAAFASLTNLRQVSLPASLEVIEESAFENCAALTYVDIPEGVMEITYAAFANCRSLQQVEMPDNLQTIGDNAFQQCFSLTEVTVPENVMEITYASFASCYNLQQVNLPENLDSIGEAAFYNTGLTEVTVPENVSSIGDSAFAACSNMLTAQLPELITEIPNGLFQYAKSLETVNIPEGVSWIGDNAFEECVSLQELTIPYSVYTIGELAFANATGMGDITFEGNAPEMADNTFFGTVVTAYYPEGDDSWNEDTLRHYGGTVTWKVPNAVIASGTCGTDLTWTLDENGLLIISGEGEMETYDENKNVPGWLNYSNQITEVRIEEGVTSVSDYAFYNAYIYYSADYGKLKRVGFPSSLTRIGDYAFQSCSSLAGELTIPGNITHIGYSAFGGCSSLTGLSLNDGLISIGWSAFAACSNLSGALVIPDTVTSLGESAFADCASLTGLKLSSSLTKIESWAFDGCYELAGTLTIPENVEEIGYYAFGMCGNLTEIQWNENLTIIELGAFQGCEKVAGALVLPNSVTYIGNNAFAGWTSMTELHLSENLTTIGAGAFFGCTALESPVYVPYGAKVIEEYAFDGCTGLQEIHIPNSVATMGTSIFSNKNANLTIHAHADSFAAQYAEKYGISFQATDHVFENDKCIYCNCDFFIGGDCGEKVTWEFEPDTGVLTISGTGEMYPYDLGMNFAPWYSYRESITEAVIEEGVTTVGDYAFASGYDNLITLTLPETLTAIGENAFAECTSLESLSLGSKLKTIGSSAFAFNLNLSGTLVIPDSVTSIGNNTFESCSNLEGLTLGSSVASIGGSAFYNCSGLSGTLMIPDSVTTIGENAFFNAGVAELILGKGLTSIGDYAFQRSSAAHMEFRSVTCPELGMDAFDDMTSLESVYVPADGYDSYAPLFELLGEGVEIQTEWYAFPVTGLTVDRTYSKTVVLSWDAHIGTTLIDYTIYRNGVAVGTTTDCTYADRELATGRSYTYTVRANFPEEHQSPASNSATGLTVQPKVTDLKVYSEYAGRNKIADVENTVTITVPNGANLEPLGQKQATVGVYYDTGAEQTLIGWAEFDEYDSTDTEAVYTIDWDLSLIDDGEYTLTAVLTDVDGTAAQRSETVLVDNTAPEKLQQMMVTGSEETISLSWTRATEYDTIGYRIYRSDGDQESFQLLTTIDNVATLSYVDETADEEQIYYYYVVAVDVFDRESTGYDIMGGTRIEDTVNPRVVQLLPASGNVLTGTAVFTMKSEDNVAVTGTKLEISVDDEATWTELPATGSSYVLDTTAYADGKIAVRAYAFDEAGNVSDALKQTYTIDNTGPAKVTGLSYVSTSVTLTLSWLDVEDEDRGWYQVEQLQSNGTYTVLSNKVTALGLNLRNLTPNTQYTYRVVAYDQFGNRGIPSDNFTASTTADITGPVITRLQPSSGSFRDSIALSATIQDDTVVKTATLQYSLDNIEWIDVATKTYTDSKSVQTITGKLDLTVLEEGLIYVRAIAADKDGNLSSDEPFVQHLVDKTGPNAPDGVTATGGGGYIEVRWSGNVLDAASFLVYRAEAADGEYKQIASGITSLNYFDRNVEAGKTYYYQVAAIDAAGNLGERSAVNTGEGDGEGGGQGTGSSAQVQADTEKPVIHSIYPADGSAISKRNVTVSVLASDNSELDSILVEYSHDGETYETLVQVGQILDYSAIAETQIPLAQFRHGDTIYIRASAADTAGNVCDSTVNTYTVDTEAPQIAAGSAEYLDRTVELTWTGNQEEDLAGYRVYRKTDGGSSTLIASRQAVAGQADYSYTDSSLSAEGAVYTYQIEAVDNVGNSSTTVIGTVEVPKDSTPTAMFTCDSVMTVGVEYILDAGSSTDDSAIVSYEFDFGDGCVSTEKSPIHAYEEAGIYDIILTVTDDLGNTHSVTKTVETKDATLIGTVTIRILDEKGTPVPGAPVYFDLGDSEKQVIRGTDNSGYVQFTTDAGRHTVGCVIPNNEWLPVKKDIIVTAGEETSITMTLVNKPIVEGRFEIERMTLDEIIAAGIDINDPENQYYVEVHVKLTYGDYTVDQSFPVGGKGNRLPPIYIPSWGIGDSGPSTGGHGSGGSGGGRVIWPYAIGGYEFSKDVAYVMLDIPIEASTLKEFFDVYLHVMNNASSDFSMLDNIITLDVPDGLTVMEGLETESQIVYINEIKGQTTETIEWILRGDEVGEYYIAADYTGTLSEFNERIDARFEADEAIEVYGMSNLKLYVEVADQLDYGTLYYNVALINEGDIDVYKPNISTDDVILAMELYDASGTVAADDSTNVDSWGTLTNINSMPMILKPDNRVMVHYMCIDQTVYTESILKLQNKLVETVGNTYGLEIELVDKPLAYFKAALDAKVNALDKAQETLEGNLSAYQQLINNNLYVCWNLANDSVKGAKLSSNMDEAAWNLMKGDLSAIVDDNNDAKQIRALILAAMELDEGNNDYVGYLTAIEWLQEFRDILKNAPITVFKGLVTKTQAEAFLAALDEILANSKWEFVNAAISQGKQALDKLLAKTWAKAMSTIDDPIIKTTEITKKIHGFLSLGITGDAWKKIGIGLDSVNKILSFADGVSSDIGLFLAAQANIRTYELYLDAIIDGIDEGGLKSKYSDGKLVYNAALDIKDTIASQNYFGKILKNVAKVGFDVLIDMGMDAMLDAVDASTFGITKAIRATMQLTALGLNALMNLNERFDRADNVRFLAVLSEAVAIEVKDAKRTFAGSKTDLCAQTYMQLISLLINLRALGESQVAEYGQSYETAFTVGSPQLFFAVQKMTKIYETSWFAWRDVVEDKISLLRVKLLKNPVSTQVTGMTAPVVSFDYAAGTTKQTFSEEYQYSLDKGATWTPCSGEPIAVEKPAMTTELWVRRIDRSNTDEVGTGSMVIYGAHSLDASDIEVIKTENGYRIENLDGDRNYQVTFSETPMSYDYETVLDTDLPDGSYSYSYTTDTLYNYVYIRTAADESGYASDIACLPIRSTLTLRLSTSGEGTVGEVKDSYEYGETVSLAAYPAENRSFDGWYNGSTLVSTDPYYTFSIYQSLYLQARFQRIAVEEEEVILPGSTGDISYSEGTGSTTTEDGTDVTITDAPEAARTLVVNPITDSEILSWAADCLQNIGTPEKLYDIYVVDSWGTRLENSGLEITLGYSGSVRDILVCGISENGTVTIPANTKENGEISFTTDGSTYYVLTRLDPNRSITVTCDEDLLMPGQEALLSAQFQPSNPTGTQIIWTLDTGDEAFVSLKASGSTATVTALKATGSRTVVVTASAADGSFPSTSIEIATRPYAQQITILDEDGCVADSKIKFDVRRSDVLNLSAEVAPMDADQAVIWSSSNETIATVEDGTVTFTGKTGTVRITAKAADGSKTSDAITIQAVALTQNLVMDADSVTEMIGGHYAYFRALDADTGKALGSTKLAWEVDEASASYATISAAGRLLTRKVSQRVEVLIRGRVIGNEEYGVVEHRITLYPEISGIDIHSYGESVTGKTLWMDPYQQGCLYLYANLLPSDAMYDLRWRSSNSSIATVDENGTVWPVWNARRGEWSTGTVTITAIAQDGSGESASVKVQLGISVSDISLSAPADTLRSGKSMSLKAQVYPENSTKGGVTWSLKDSADKAYVTLSASGRLTAKTVYDEYPVTVVASAKDGSGVSSEITITVKPKTDGILTLYRDGENVTRQTITLDLETEPVITLSAYTLGLDEEETVTWKSSNQKVAAVDESGVVTLMRTGTAVITAIAADGRTAAVTLKPAKLAEEILVTSKTGGLEVASGKSIILNAQVYPSDATNKGVTWYIPEEYQAYAGISATGKLAAAKNLTYPVSVPVIVTSKDGAVQTELEVQIYPIATAVSIYGDTELTGTTYVHDMAADENLQLYANVFPLNLAMSAVTWKSSSSRVATVDEDGMVTCLKPGTTTITATARDGSGKKASFKLTVVKRMTELTLEDGILAGGKSLTLKPIIGPEDVTNKTLTWSMSGEGAAFATLNSRGVLRAKTVTEPKTLTVTAESTDGSGLVASCQITLYPATTKVQILFDGEPVKETLTLVEGEDLDLDGLSLPISAAEAYTWKSSAPQYAQVDGNGLVTGLRSGKTVTITCIAADGTRKSASVKVQVISASGEWSPPAV